MTDPGTGPEDITVSLTISAQTAELLSALIDPELGLNDLVGVIYELIDHAQQGVYRPGAWERDWLCRAFGYDWPDRLEPDTERLSADGRVIFQRPERDDG